MRRGEAPSLVCLTNKQFLIYFSGVYGFDFRTGASHPTENKVSRCASRFFQLSHYFEQ